MESEFAGGCNRVWMLLDLVKKFVFFQLCLLYLLKQACFKEDCHGS